MNRIQKEYYFNNFKHYKHILTTNLYLKDFKVVYETKNIIDYVLLIMEDDNGTPLIIATNDSFIVDPYDRFNKNEYYTVQIFSNVNESDKFTITIHNSNQEIYPTHIIHPDLMNGKNEIITTNNTNFKRTWIESTFKPEKIMTNRQRKEHKKQQFLNKYLI